MAERIAAFGPNTLAWIASNLADSLYRFADEYQDAGPEIRAVITKLYGIKALLTELDARFLDRRFDSLSRDLLDDIALGVGSCCSTLKNLDGIVFRTSMSRRGTTPISAKKAWNEILSSFRNLEGASLQRRLDVHRTFLLNLAGLLRTIFAPASPTLSKKEQKAEAARLQAEAARLQEQIRTLANQQEKAHARMREMEENHRRSMEEQAYQTRYSIPSPRTPAPVSPRASVPVSTRPYDSPPQRPFSTPLPSPPFPVPLERYIPQTLHENRPMTPVSPTSPISPISPLSPSRRFSLTPGPGMNRLHTPPSTPPMTRPKTRAGGNPMLPSKAQESHWWSQVFGMSPGSTSLAEPLMQSTCYGIEMDNLTMAPEEHEIFRVEFDGDLMLRMFRNEATEEAKVVCTRGGSGGSWNSGRRGGYRYQTFVSASKLDIARVGSGIQLLRRNLVWAELFFADFETMTLFYHAFLALRYNAPTSTLPKESEYWLDGESLVFSANIDDDGFVHALRLLKDNESGCIRLAAAKHDGEHDVTVWTAFLTSQIGQTKWFYPHGEQSVIMKNIRQFSFSAYFDTTLWREFELRFLKTEDARAFAHVINQESKKVAAQRKAEYQAKIMSQHRDSYF